MRVSVERMPGSTVAVDIYSDESEFSAAVEKAVRKINRDITIPGFRRGKRARHIVERMVGHDAVVEEAGRDMMEDMFRRAVEQEELVPVGQPEVEILQAEPFGFKVTVAVFPEPTLGDYQSVRVEPREVELADDEVDTVVEQLRKSKAEWLELETPRLAREGDQVTLDLKVFEGDEPFQEPAEDATFVLGESQMFEAIEDAIKMMTIGSAAELTLSFEEDDQTVNPELRGKALRYAITLKDVKQRSLPELDDELAKEAGPFETVNELLEQIRKDLLRNKAQEARSELTTEVVNAMAETAEIEVPDALVEREVEDQVTQFKTRLAQQRMTYEEYLTVNGQTEEEFRAEMQPDAARRVRNSIVLQEIAKAEGVEVTPEDIEAEIDRLVGPAENPERLRTLYESDYFKDLLQTELYDRKLTDRLLEIATEGRGAVTGAGAAALEEEPTPPRRRETTAEQAGETDLSDDDANVVELAGDIVPDASEQLAAAADADVSDDTTIVAETATSDGPAVEAAREDWSAEENTVDFGSDLEPDDPAQPVADAKQASADAGE